MQNLYSNHIWGPESQVRGLRASKSHYVLFLLGLREGMSGSETLWRFCRACVGMVGGGKIWKAGTLSGCVGSSLATKSNEFGMSSGAHRLSY